MFVIEYNFSKLGNNYVITNPLLFPRDKILINEIDDIELKRLEKMKFRKTLNVHILKTISDLAVISLFKNP